MLNLDVLQILPQKVVLLYYLKLVAFIMCIPPQLQSQAAL